MLNEAKKFIKTMYTELNFKSADMTQRLIEVENEINQTGTYYHTQQELEYGAKMAWRNSNRCIGRFYWQSLTVEDARGIEQEDDFINSIENHIVQATNNGKIKPYITIFHPEHPPRIYNNQLIRYAGYTDCGDPAEKEVTRLAEHLGWTSEHTQFDVLPLIYKLPNGVMKYHDYPTEIIKEINIEHEQFPKLKQLGLKWYAVPIISNMELRIGGITYPTAPFNGWYMVNEIAVRNFTDVYRYNLLETVAHAFEFDTLKNNSFNKDRALVELNYAVYHSFKQAGVSIVDHLTASRQFEVFEKNEAKRQREVTGKWSWLVPSLSPTLVSNYHHGYPNIMKDPNFHYKKAQSSGCPFH
ncbi:nitric oxide synthase oxygenase [Staphylococcus sp. 18_1_E_LY]|uniref:Nitric oxide synthase oxygenase n=1 Tax=Staphylococcus lloydii TaxID=2781774 RepID=A0A7T1B270_9STAP|nr:nitric oxide synthase oxygenase [Staphylococcus lloydii]MBF7020578.1 nitric oxide synthase oxygenase [Staphylococcus lloydii]MBF7028261.1 nitric oxide synthase oxygenase [Staphylococcus lloydii]QPM76339.1 nitric oxide synthase oxygenase [Staphylococcus lloydii]